MFIDLSKQYGQEIKSLQDFREKVLHNSDLSDRQKQDILDEIQALLRAILFPRSR